MARLLIAALVALSACSPEPDRYAVPDAPPPERVSIAYRSVSVLKVGLPSYAALEEIAISGPGGLVQTSPETLWADNPERAVTLELTRTLAQATGATVAPEPWPFLSAPDATLDVRLEDLLANGTGQFRLKGQYFVAPADPNRRERARLFDISVPYAPDGGIPAIARARSEAVADLAILIAREGLR